MFFESLPAGEEPAPRRLPERSPWSGPPPLETGAVLAVERMVARSANVVVRVPVIRAFRPGCMIDVEIVSRQGALSDDDWWDLHLSAHRGLFGSHGGKQLPDKLLRLGVRYADGTKATTIEQRRRQTPAPADPPTGPGGRDAVGRVRPGRHRVPCQVNVSRSWTLISAARDRDVRGRGAG